MATFARFNCSICTDWLDASTPVVSLHCGHVYHEECINRSLIDSPSCPSCRDRVRPEDIRRNFYSTGEFNQSDAQVELDRAYALIAKLEREHRELKAGSEGGSSDEEDEDESSEEEGESAEEEDEEEEEDSHESGDEEESFHIDDELRRQIEVADANAFESFKAIFSRPLRMSAEEDEDQESDSQEDESAEDELFHLNEEYDQQGKPIDPALFEGLKKVFTCSEDETEDEGEATSSEQKRVAELFLAAHPANGRSFA